MNASANLWTIFRPAGLFGAQAVSNHEVATSRLPGRFTSRADLAHALLRQDFDDERHSEHVGRRRA